MPPGVHGAAMQKVDPLHDLRSDDPKIDRDAEILEIIRRSARKVIANPSRRSPGRVQPSLYSRYRGTGFPIEKGRNQKIPNIPSWRNLSPWMKVQLATLALAEHGYMQFKLHIHDDLMAEITRDGLDPKTVLRDRMCRHLKRRLGHVPWFFFIMEEYAKDGTKTRPHGHGSILVPRARLPKSGKGSRRLKAIAANEGIEKAEIEAGYAVICKALKAAGGAGRGRFAITTGVDQCRNLWHRPPYHALFNSQWVDYAFKHAKTVSNLLGDGRLAINRGLTQEAQRLWTLITRGEVAITLWPQSDSP
jgi:hypothetical protein